MNIYRKLTGSKPFRSHPWSCSDFADKISVLFFEQKPSVGTYEDFREWEKQAKESNAIVYWLVEEGFDIVQDILYFPRDVYVNLRSIIRNIFITKSHCIPTKLPKGKFYDWDTRIAEGLMFAIVDFVEVEKAHMYYVFSDEENVEALSPREAGLAYLDWEINEDDFDSNILESQSAAAKEIKELYLWVTDVYPNRPDPYDESGWSEIYQTAAFPIKTQDERTEKENEEIRDSLHTLRDLEEEQEEELTDKLVRIVKIRNTLWT